MGALKFKDFQSGDPVLDRVQGNIATLASQIRDIPPPNIVTVTANYRVNGTEDAVHVDSSAGAVQVTLQSPSSSNRPLIVKQINLQSSKTKVNPVTVVTADGSKVIAGQASYALDNTGTGSVSITADDQQHWPVAGTGGNPPGPSPGGLVYTGIPPIYVAGTVIYFKPAPTPPVPVVTPWVAPPSFSGTGPFNDSSGAETWKAESMVDFTGAPAALTAYFWFESQSAGGTATYNVRVGGSAFQALDGVVVATFSDPTATLTPHSVATPFATPGGLQRVTLSMKSAGATLAAKLGFQNVLFR